MLQSTQLWRKGCCGSRGSGSPKFVSTLEVTRLRSTGRTRSSSLPGSRRATASPTACGGKRLAGTRKSVSSILAGDDSNGRAIRRVLLRRMPLQQVLVTLPTKPRQRAKARRQEEGRKEFYTRWSRCGASAVVSTQFLHGGPVCVCRSDRQLPFVKPTPSRRAGGRGRSCCHKRARPYPLTSLRLPFWWAVDAGLRFVLNFANYTIAITGSTSQEVFVSSGYLDVSSAASSDWAFTYQRILHSLQSFERSDAFEVGEGALSKFVTGQVCDYLGFSSESSFAKDARAPSVRQSWPRVGGTLLSCTSTDFRSACCFLKRTIQFVCSVIVQPTSSKAPCLAAAKGCMLALSRLRLGVGRSPSCSILSVSLAVLGMQKKVPLGFL